MSAHTPGPWAAVEWERHAPTTIVRDVEGRRTVIAEVEGGDSAEVLANARLIAAAPDLLMALRALLARSDMEYWPLEQEVARAAIAKAEDRQ